LTRLAAWQRLNVDHPAENFVSLASAATAVTVGTTR
jgi:hypothetical protein